MRCKSVVFVNALGEEECDYRNATFVFNQEGKVLGKYCKKHLPPFEIEILQLASEYTHEFFLLQEDIFLPIRRQIRH